MTDQKCELSLKAFISTLDFMENNKISRAENYHLLGMHRKELSDEEVKEAIETSNADFERMRSYLGSLPNLLREVIIHCGKEGGE